MSARSAILGALLLGGVLSIAPLAPSALAQGMPGMGEGKQPLEIDADQAIEWHQDVRAYVARGNASAKQGGSTVFADVLTAYYRQVPGQGNVVFQIVADGNARIVSPSQEVFGERAIYDVDKQVAVVTGRNLKLVTPEHVVTARDSLEYYEARDLAVARGDAVAVRGQDRITADVLIGQFKDGPDGASRMERLDGSGNVVVTTPTDVARAEKMVYSIPDDTAVLIGNVKITRGQNQLNGQAAEMNMKTRINRVISGEQAGGRVKGLLIPGQTGPDPKAPSS
ncbi:LptA/OstA family protein [Azospirillum sp. SYSU D00513]|uniref:LptA/OstA family protein n=1 Tax=Azospirillum sp. SYSU D00513 TaxID=2812561 RepID=UPI001A95F262|nr:LptA/OstA family protein [Azospirillum sp. SYSU D00513]